MQCRTQPPGSSLNPHYTRSSAARHFTGSACCQRTLRSRRVDCPPSSARPCEAGGMNLSLQIMGSFSLKRFCCAMRMVFEMFHIAAEVFKLVGGRSHFQTLPVKMNIDTNHFSVAERWGGTFPLLVCLSSTFPLFPPFLNIFFTRRTFSTAFW